MTGTNLRPMAPFPIVNNFVRCAGLFFTVFLGLYWLYHVADSWLPSYYGWLARTVAGAIALFDPRVAARDNLILFEGSPSLIVVEGCDGITVFILIIAAVLAFPKPLGERLLGLSFLLPLLFAINWLRLAVLAAIRFYWPEQFTVAHVYLFQPTMVLATFACFIAWIMYDGRQAGSR